MTKYFIAITVLYIEHTILNSLTLSAWQTLMKIFSPFSFFVLTQNPVMIIGVFNYMKQCFSNYMTTDL